MILLGKWFYVNEINSGGIRCGEKGENKIRG